MSDKWLCRICISSIFHEEMLEFARQSANVEHPISVPHAFKINDNNPRVVPEQEIGRGCIPVDEHFPVLPNKGIFLPAMEKMEKLVLSLVVKETRTYVLPYDTLEILAFDSEIHVVAVSSVIMQPGKEKCQRSKFSEKAFTVTIPYSSFDEM